MSYDGVVTCAMTQELKRELTLGKIEKIYQPQPDQLLLSVHTARGRRKLFISASGNHSAVYLTENNPENPVQPPLFCMVLRKHLGAARIQSISQCGCDRIIEIDLETVDELGFNVNKRLICEIMGKHSNVILVDLGTGKIIESIKHVGIDVNRARQILPGKLYEYPPLQDKTPFTDATEEDVDALMAGQLQPERNLLAGIQGISPGLALSIASAPSPCAFLDDLRTAVCAQDGAGLSPRVYTKNGAPVDFHVAPLAAYESDSSYESVPFDSVSRAAEFYFVNRESSNTIKQKSGDLQRHIKAQLDKLRLKVQRLNEDMVKAMDADKYRLRGELLNANLHLVQPGARSVTVTSYYDGSTVEIPLDPKYSPARNAQNYYKKYAKAKTGKKEKLIQLEECEKDIEYLSTVQDQISLSSTYEEMELIRDELIREGYLRGRQAKDRKRAAAKAKPKPRRFTLPCGREIAVGRNNAENDYITFKVGGKTDYWLHTKDIHGSHVVLFMNGDTPGEDEIYEAAAVAAWYSKGKESQNVPVDYVPLRYVKKPSGAKPGMVIFTNNRTVWVDPKDPETMKK